MFLLIPVDVMDNSTPEIREYLETGQHLSKVKQMQKKLLDSQNKVPKKN